MFALCAPCSDASLQLLHNPPPPPVAISVIPLPLLSTMFELADKYVIDSPLVESLKVHLEAHAPAHPLQVYSFATLHDMDRIASEASQYVMPMASYRLDEVKVIPSVQAYHKIVRLQDFRVRALRELLLAEEIFPHGKYYLTWLERWVKLAPKVTANVHLTATKRWRVGIGSVRR